MHLLGFDGRDWLTIFKEDFFFRKNDDPNIHHTIKKGVTRNLLRLEVFSVVEE